MQCPLGCAALARDETPLRDNRMGLPHVVHIGWCPSCGLGVTLDPPPPEELARLYEQGLGVPQDKSAALALRRTGTSQAK